MVCQVFRRPPTSNFKKVFHSTLLSKDATTRLGWELNHQPCDYGSRKNDAPNLSATLPTNFSSHNKALQLQRHFLSHTLKDTNENEWNVIIINNTINTLATGRQRKDLSVIESYSPPLKIISLIKTISTVFKKRLLSELCEEVCNSTYKNNCTSQKYLTLKVNIKYAAMQFLDCLLELE